MSDKSIVLRIFLLLFLLSDLVSAFGSDQSLSSPVAGPDKRIRDYIDSLRIIDTHEHLFDPELLKRSGLLDFFLLLNKYSYDDLISAGMPDSLFEALYSGSLTPREKWKLIEPYWDNSFNTGFIRVARVASQELFNIRDINDSTVDQLSGKVKDAYGTDWFNHVLRDLCRIDYVIQDGDRIETKDNYILNAKTFSSWITVKSKYRIDSLAIKQVDPIFTLEDFVRSIRTAFKAYLEEGMVAVKINVAYCRTLKFEDARIEDARKVFGTLVNGDEDFSISYHDAKPLQDYIFHRLMEIAAENKIPVVIHTGMQSGKGNILANSDPTLLTDIFKQYPGINFALFHGSYPFGGELSSLAKTFRNVYIDMNWAYSISPTWSQSYLNEWLEVVPAGKIMAFGGDYNNVENIYGVLIIARNIIANVLINKVKCGYFTEKEARIIARMILHDNAAAFYKLKL